MSLLLCFLLALPAVYAQSSNLFRPCQFGDYRCVGGYLAANSRCNPQVQGAVASQYIIYSFPFKTPYFNISNIDYNLNITNHQNCSLSEFSYNSATNSWVLALRCPGLRIQSTRTMIQHYPGREDEYYYVDFSGFYPEIILTVNLRPANYVNLCTAPAFAYLSALPTYQLTGRDLASQSFLTKLELSRFDIYEREAFSYRANELLRYYVNSVFCNFGCDF